MPQDERVDLQGYKIKTREAAENAVSLFVSY